MTDFVHAIRNKGFEPPDYVEPGQFYRYPSPSKGRGNSVGWCKLFGDGRAGVFGDWITGEQWNWFQDEKNLSDRDLGTHQAKANQAKRDEEYRREVAKQDANVKWNEAKPCGSHPYLTKKGVKSYGLRSSGDQLLIPVTDGNTVVALQRIYADSNEVGKHHKRFTKDATISGHYFKIGQPDKIIYLVEGYATGASVHEATGEAVVIAFNAGNLNPVSETMIARFPNAKLIVAADNDANNIGQQKAQETGLEVRTPPEEGDWNDYHLKHGLDAVKQKIDYRGPIGLAKYSVNRGLDEMKQRLLDEKFVLEDLALQGQLTCFYARQNSGKTLITIRLLLDAVKTGRLNPEDIFFVNADDDPKNAHLKGQILDEAGIQMVVMHEQGFEPKDLLPALREMEMAGEAHSKVVIIDTLKKFVNLMDKTELSKVFNPALKRFQSAGGTIIGMAHTNKQLVNGKPIHSGVTDVLDDFDCVYTIDTVGENDKTRTVEFDANPPQGKTRGSNKKVVQFCYDLEPVNYRALVESVRMVSEFEAADVKRQKAINDKLEANAEEIETILECISAGIIRKTELIKEAAGRCAVTKPKIARVLRDHKGPLYKQGHRWQEYPGEANSKLYRATRPREAAQEYKKASGGE